MQCVVYSVDAAHSFKSGIIKTPTRRNNKRGERLTSVCLYGELLSGTVPSIPPKQSGDKQCFKNFPVEWRERQSLTENHDDGTNAERLQEEDGLARLDNEVSVVSLETEAGARRLDGEIDAA
ncbi:hypothetical protein MHYP_G00257370 [Metynnis hypsauchen]